MQPKLHLIVCEGKSEWVYVRRLQRFLDSLPLPPNTFETPLRFVGPEHAAAKNGAFGKLLSSYNKARRDIDLLPALKGRDSLKQPACEAGGSVEGRFPFHRSLKLLHGQWRQVLPTLYSERRSHRHGRCERI